MKLFETLFVQKTGCTQYEHLQANKQKRGQKVEKSISVLLP